MIAHLNALSHHPWLNNAWKVFFCERNTGHQSGVLGRIVDKFQPSYNVYQPLGANSRFRSAPSQDIHFETSCDNSVIAKGNPGIWTDRRMKENYGVAARRYLATNGVSYLKGCVSANPKKTPETSFSETRREFESQLARARPVCSRPSVDTGVSPRVSWSAKTGPDGKMSEGMNDDLLFTFAMGCHWLPLFIAQEIQGIPYQRLGLTHVHRRAASEMAERQLERMAAVPTHARM